MALIKAHADHPAAYHTVNMLVASTQAGVQILVVTHASKEAHDAGEGEVATRQFDLPFVALTSPDPISYAYERLKALPDFEGAIESE